MDEIPTSSPYDVIPMEEALNKIADSLDAIPPEMVPTADSLHRILASDIHTPVAHPPFRASIKDGYAIRVASQTASDALRVRAESHAGGGMPAALHDGEAVYVTTGAPVPASAHAVVMVEDCQREGDALTMARFPDMGTDIREIGADLALGQLVLEKGTRIGAAEIGLLATCTIAHVRVAPRPVIGVLSTGDELVELTRAPPTLPFGHVVDSNRPMLLAAIRESLPFCQDVDLGIARDSRADVRDALRRGIARCDVVVTSGGVSMGRRDVVKPLLHELGNVHFGRVCMKPGKPLTFATSRTAAAATADEHTRCFVGLPGNPVSSFVCFHLAVAVAARRLAGWSRGDALGRTVEVRLGHDVRLDESRPEYHRASLRWQDGQGYVATSTGRQASSRLLSARSANALLVLPTGQGSLGGGSRVRAYLLNHEGEAER